MTNDNTRFRIIVIDDNAAIQQDFIKILTTSKVLTSDAELELLNQSMFGQANTESLLDQFEIDTASQGQEGVEKIKQALEQGRPYSLAFVDIRMPPGWDGVETIKHIWALDKDIQIVICTAYSDYSWEETVKHLGQTDCLLILKKPFDNVSVRQLTCAMTKKWQLLINSRNYTKQLKDDVEDRTLSLKKSLSLVKATLESSNDGVLVINNENNTLEFNQRFIKMWHIPIEMAHGQSTKEVMLRFMASVLENNIEFNEFMNDEKLSGDMHINVIKFKDGRIFESYSQPQLVDKVTVGNVYNFHDVTEREKLEKELLYQATHDGLTCLPNRVLLHENIQKEINKSSVNKNTFAIIFLDLNRFKLINDSLSHAAGDELLIEVASRLQSKISNQDTLARLGGDEFVILLASIRDKADLMQRANTILEVFSIPFHVANRDIFITSSMGVSLYPDNGETIDALLKNADSAMYNAKINELTGFSLYSDEMNNKSLGNLDFEMELRSALTNDELFLVYQPQFDLKQKNIIGAEALIRWQHSTKGLLLPLDFIPLAEESGLIIPIGEWVLKTVCMKIKAWCESGLPCTRISVGISVAQLKQSGFIAFVKNILLETGINPKYLELELTENAAISSLNVINSVVELKKLGVEVSIDDFGSGYKSLSHLRKLPLGRVKIDSSFIQNITSSTDDEVIMRAIISVANNLNLNLIADGVETANQLDYLKNNFCDEIQGYRYSKPISIADLEVLLKSTADIAEDTNMVS
jgi:diguanylate cyclase (GGDEF)-like protein/PAS domain S-box-containing protein